MSRSATPALRTRPNGHDGVVARATPAVRTAFLDHPTPLAFAHRGYSPDGFENTFRAFAAAIDLGFRYVETDVRASADGVAVTFHDARLDRLTDRQGRVHDLPWSELRRARIGGYEPIPTLEEVLDAWPELRLNIDVKDPSAVSACARAIDRTRAHDRVCIASFSDRRRRAVLRRLSAPVVTSGGRQTVARFRGASALRLSALVTRLLREVDCLQVPVRVGGVQLVTPRTIAATHATGRHLHVWTVNNADEMERALDLGADGLMSDRAEVLRDVLRRRGFALS
ncbi:MAG: glycerophosphodiester phosphodiesterase [Jiangellaceae bacterium]|nr:glycerophosphodiester phosphodiesterase [Jiangellaceae bacterium]